MNLTAYDPKKAEDRAYVIQHRLAQLQREGKNYDEAWQTMNSQDDMHPFVAAMKSSESEEQSMAAAITRTLRGQMVGRALHGVETSLNGLNLGAAKDAIFKSPLLRPLVDFAASRATANARVVTYSPSQTDATLESLATTCTAQILRAAIDSAVSSLSNFIAADAAASEVYADPLFAPMVDWLKKATGEDLRTGNSGIAGHALTHFLKGAIARHGMGALRRLAASNPSFEQLGKFLKGEATANQSPDLSTSAARGAAVRALVGKRQEQYGEPYEQAFAAVRADAGNAALFHAMRQPAVG